MCMQTSKLWHVQIEDQFICISSFGLVGRGCACMRPHSGVQKNRVFRKQGLCVTPASFVIFVLFRGLRSKALVFVDRVSIRHFRRFRQNPLFSVGGKDPVWLRPHFSPPDSRFRLSSSVLCAHASAPMPCGLLHAKVLEPLCTQIS